MSGRRAWEYESLEWHILEISLEIPSNPNSSDLPTSRPTGGFLDLRAASRGASGRNRQDLRRREMDGSC